MSFFSVINPGFLWAKNYTFSWSANPEPVEGYYLYYKKGGKASLPLKGDDAEEGPSPIDIGKETSFTITGLDPYETYHFALTAYNEDVESSFTPVVTVIPKQLKAVASELSYGGEAPLIVEFKGSASSGDIVRYLWEFGDGVIATRADPSHIYTMPGSYTARLSVTDSTGTIDHASLEILVSAPAPRSFDPPTAVIATPRTSEKLPLTIEFSGGSSTSPHPPITSFAWDFGDGHIAELESPTHTFTIPGTYTVTLIVSDSSGEIAQTKLPVTVKPPPNLQNDFPVAVLDANPLEGKPPLVVSYDAADSFDPDGSIYLYHLNFGDGFSTYDSAGKHKYTEFGTYTITLRVTDYEGATSTLSTRVSAMPKNGSSPEYDSEGVVNIIKYLLLND